MSACFVFSFKKSFLKLFGIRTPYSGLSVVYASCSDPLNIPSVIKCVTESSSILHFLRSVTLTGM